MKVKRKSRTNRANYIGQALVWVLTMLGYHYSKLAEINAATTLTQCEAITWSLAQFDVLNPQVAIQTALTIQD